MGSQFEVERLGAEDFLCLGIQHLPGGCARLRLIADVAQAGSQRGFIAVAEEAGQVELRHQFLLRHNSLVQVGCHQVSRMGKTRQVPGRHTLGQGEGDGSRALGIGTQLRHEEGQLVQVLPEQRGINGRFFRTRPFCFLGRDIESGIISPQGLVEGSLYSFLCNGIKLHGICRCHCIYCSCILIHPGGCLRSGCPHQHRLTFLACIHQYGEISGIPRRGLKGSYAEELHGEVQVTAQPFGEVVAGDDRQGGDVIAEAERQVQRMGRQGIERSVVETEKHIGIGRRTVGTAQGEAPFLLLTRPQVIAERVPMGAQGHIGLLEAEYAFLGMQVAFVVEGYGEACPLAVGLLIGQFPQEDAVLDVYNRIQIQSSLGNHGAVNPSVLEAGADLNAGRSFGREGVCWAVNPQGGIDCQARIVLAEEGYLRLVLRLVPVHLGSKTSLVSA